MGAKRARWARVRFEIFLGGFVEEEEGREGSARGSHFSTKIRKDSGSSVYLIGERERKRKREGKDNRRTPKPESSCLTTTKLCLFEPLYEPRSGSVDARARRARRSEGERE